jgi:proteasome lid subunit RPN8/RPN11
MWVEVSISYQSHCLVTRSARQKAMSIRWRQRNLERPPESIKTWFHWPPEATKSKSDIRFLIYQKIPEAILCRPDLNQSTATSPGCALCQSCHSVLDPGDIAWITKGYSALRNWRRTENLSTLLTASCSSGTCKKNSACEVWVPHSVPSSLNHASEALSRKDMGRHNPEDLWNSCVGLILLLLQQEKEESSEGIALWLS